MVISQESQIVPVYWVNIRPKCLAPLAQQFMTKKLKYEANKPVVEFEESSNQVAPHSNPSTTRGSTYCLLLLDLTFSRLYSPQVIHS